MDGRRETQALIRLCASKKPNPTAAPIYEACEFSLMEIPSLPLIGEGAGNEASRENCRVHVESMARPRSGAGGDFFSKEF